MIKKFLKIFIPVPIKSFNKRMDAVVSEARKEREYLKKVIEEQNRLIKEQREEVNNHYEQVKKQNEEIKKQNNIIQQKQNEEIKKQNNIIQKQNEEIKKQNNIIQKQNEDIYILNNLTTNNINEFKRELESTKVLINNTARQINTTTRNGISGLHTKIWEVRQESKIMHYELLDPSQYKSELCKWYNNETGQMLDLENPITFSEKLQWLKLNDSTPLKTRLADKYSVRDWVKEKVGEEYLIPIIGVYNKFEEIDFDKLPEKFVLKTTHSSGWNIIVQDKSKLNMNEAKRKLDRWMHLNFAFANGFELHYRNVERKIMIEEYSEEVNDTYSYYIFCFNGRPYHIWVCNTKGASDRRIDVYDLEWNKQSINTILPNFDNNIKKPETLNTMLDIAEKLSKDFRFARVDLYEINNRVYFSEITFTPNSGKPYFSSYEIDKMYGDKLKLPNN